MIIHLPSRFPVAPFRANDFICRMKRNLLKKILAGLAVLILLLQLIPGDTNAGSIHGPDHIANVVPVPPDVEQVLKRSCYDCHSNQTVYPWYSRIQPVRLWLDDHVKEGKAELNFSAFAAYSLKRQLHKLDEVVEVIDEHEMPLSSYTLAHRDAILDEAQKARLTEWARQSRLVLQQGN